MSIKYSIDIFEILENYETLLQIQIVILRDELGSTRQVMTKSLNFCDTLKKDKKIYPDIVKVSNLPNQNICPFSKVIINELYNIDTYIYLNKNKKYSGKLHNT